MAKVKRATWFKVFLSDKPICDEASDADLGSALKAALQYFESGTLMELTPIQKMIFAKFRVAVDEAKADYEKSVKNGEKGGRPPKGDVTHPNPGLPILTHADEEADAEREIEAEANKADFSLKDKRETAAAPQFPHASDHPVNESLDFESKRKNAIDLLERHNDV